MILMIVGDIHEQLAKFAVSVDPSAKILTKDSLVTLATGTYYISVGDFDHYRQYVDFLAFANKIIYHPPAQWSDVDRKGFSYMKHWTELSLEYFYDKIEIENFVIPPLDTTNILNLVDTRKTSDAQIWVTGGSDSHGVGVEQSERYGQLIADHLNLQVSFLTTSAASTHWTADQLLRSDLRSGDLVIFGTVPTSRLSYYYNKQLVHLCVTYYTKNPSFDRIYPLSLLDSDHVSIYQPITAVNQVVNICEKLGVHLIIADLASSLVSQYHCFPNYINLCHYRFGFDNCNRFLDLGTDNSHPGPATHQFYAENIITKIKQLKFNVPNLDS